MDKHAPIYKRTLAHTVKTGMAALTDGHRRLYLLEHRTASAYHKLGETQRMVVDQIELGRAKDCQVRFDERFPTVSRRHAAIVDDGKEWRIVHLSTTNDTFVNGERVETERTLHNGDEIQLSAEGPRLGFLVPQGGQGLTGSLGVGLRLSLVVQQSLRPYRYTLAALAALLMASIVAVAMLIPHAAAEPDLTSCTPFVYSIETTECSITYPKRSPLSIALTGSDVNDSVPTWVGTGFLLDDGRFVTAHHVVEPWKYPAGYLAADSRRPWLDSALNAGCQVEYTFLARAPTGDTLVLRGSQFVRGHGPAQQHKIDPDDYAWTRVQRDGGLAYDTAAATALPMRTRLYTLGFPYARGIGNVRVSPQCSEARTTDSGLEPWSGMIVVGQGGFALGNSGGPVFYADPHGKPVVIGIVSAVGQDKAGFAVPLSRMYQQVPEP